MNALKRSRTSARGRSLARAIEPAMGRTAAALTGRLGKRRAHMGCGTLRNTRPPEMRGQAQRVVAGPRRGESIARRLMMTCRPARQAVSAFRSRFRRPTQHACATNELTQLKSGTCRGVTNITFRVSCQRRGSGRAMHPRQLRVAVYGARKWLTTTKELAVQNRLRPLRERAAVDRFANCIYKRGIGFAATPGRRALPQTFVRMKTADGHWGTTGQQPVRELAIDMPARPARSTGEQ